MVSNSLELVSSELVPQCLVLGAWTTQIPTMLLTTILGILLYYLVDDMKTGKLIDF